MAKCQFCGKTEVYPYKCRYCGGLFCSEHRLPPKHNCINLDEWRSKSLYFYVDSKGKIERELKMNEISVSRQRTKKRPRIKAYQILAIALIVVFVLVGYGNISEKGILSETNKLPSHIKESDVNPNINPTTNNPNNVNLGNKPENGKSETVIQIIKTCNTELNTVRVLKTNHISARTAP